MRTIEEVIAELRKDIHSDVYLGKKTINTYLGEILEIHKAERLQGKWISVSERLPDDREWYLGTFQETDTGWINPLPYICDYTGNTTKFTTQDGWIIRDCTDVDSPIEYYTKLLRCVAWRPLPESYTDI